MRRGYFEIFLARRCDSVHVTQAISQRFHHVRGEMRRLLNKKMKPRSNALWQMQLHRLECFDQSRSPVLRWLPQARYDISKKSVDKSSLHILDRAVESEGELLKAE